MYILPLKNISRRKSQAAATILITALTTFVFVVIFHSFVSIRAGLDLTTSRLGADVVVLPDKANASVYDTIFTAEPQNIYMEEQIIKQLASFDGIDKITKQFFTQTLDESCCSIGKEMRLVGYDKKTDFILSPWLKEHDLEYPDDSQIIAGNAVPAFLGNRTIILGKLFTVAGTLYPTGTGMDNTLFIDMDVARNIAENSPLLDEYWQGRNVRELISSVMINTVAGYDPQLLADAINDASLNVTATATSNVISTTRNQILVLGKIIWVLWGVIFFISALALWGRFNSLTRERRAEIGLLRAMGVHKNQVFLLILTETWLLAAMGGIIGSFFGTFAAKPIVSELQTQLSLAVSQWSVSGSIISVLAGIVVAMLLGFIASIYPCYKGSMMEPIKAFDGGMLD